MTESKTNLSLQDLNVIETALETSAAINATTIKHLERMGEHRAADSLRLQANLIATARDALMPAPVRIPRATSFHGRAAVEDALRGTVDLDAPSHEAVNQ